MQPSEKVSQVEFSHYFSSSSSFFLLLHLLPLLFLCLSLCPLLSLCPPVPFPERFLKRTSFRLTGHHSHLHNETKGTLFPSLFAFPSAALVSFSFLLCVIMCLRCLFRNFFRLIRTAICGVRLDPLLFCFISGLYVSLRPSGFFGDSSKRLRPILSGGNTPTH